MCLQGTHTMPSEPLGIPMRGSKAYVCMWKALNGKSSLVHALTCYWKSVCLWRPWQSKISRKISREFEQFFWVDFGYPSCAAGTLHNGGCRTLSSLVKQWKHHTNLKNVLEDSFPPTLEPRLIVWRKPLSYFNVLCVSFHKGRHIFLNFRSLEDHQFFSF